MTNESKEPLLMSTLIEEEDESTDKELNDDNHNLILKNSNDKSTDKYYQDSIKINMKNSHKDDQNLLKNYIDKTHKKQVQMLCIGTALFYGLCSFLILVINKIVLTVYRYVALLNKMII